MSENDELLPCPFCGSDPNLHKVDYINPYDLKTYSLMFGCDECHIYFFGDYENPPDEKWDNRKGQKAHDKEMRKEGFEGAKETHNVYYEHGNDWHTVKPKYETIEDFEEKTGERMKSKNGYKKDKPKTSTGKWLKRYFHKRTCRRKNNA